MPQGRPREVTSPVSVLMYIGEAHREKLKALATRWKVRGPSAALRKILDEYDFKQ